MALSTGPGVRRPGRVIGVMVAAQMLIWLDNSILNIAVHRLADPVAGLGAGPEALEWAISSYSLVLAAATFAGGALADRYGPRRTLVAGLVILATGSAVAAFAPTPGVLIAARAVMGAGGALLMPATLSIIVHVSSPERRTRAIAIWASASGAGVAIGPVAGGLLLEHFWWGSIFLVNVPVAGLCLLGIRAVVPALRYPERRPLDPVGLLLSLAGLGGVVYGVLTGSSTGSWSSPGVLLPLAGGAVLLIVFVRTQRTAANPSFDPRLFGRPEFTAGALTLMFAFLGLTGQLYYAAFYLQGVRALTPLAAGLLMVPAAVGITAGNQLAPALTRRRPARLVVAAGLLAAVVTYGAYGWMDERTPLVVLAVLLLVQGAGMGLVSTPVTAVMMAALPPERTGAGSAVNSAVRQVGGTFGVAVLGSVLTAAYRRGMGPATTGLPSPAAAEALVSPEAARAVAVSLGRPELTAAANGAFLHAMAVTAGWTCALTLVGVLITLGWLRPPGRR
jgi:EmrB/QacA subfamily drug resistance transporter